MILSVSRRTDIPNYYSEWFLNRIREGFLYVRNPMNPRQISRIDLSPETTDCIVFWTKNPAPMLDRLEELKDYAYYFQFTLTGYGRDVEPNLPDKRKVLIPVFRALSEKIGKEKVIWRYDPIFLTLLHICLCILYFVRCSFQEEYYLMICLLISAVQSWLRCRRDILVCFRQAGSWNPCGARLL